MTRLRWAGDLVWEAHSRNYGGFAHPAQGKIRQADADFAVAEPPYAAGKQAFEFAEARQNRCLVAFVRGDLPLALECSARPDSGWSSWTSRGPTWRSTVTG